MFGSRRSLWALCMAAGLVGAGFLVNGIAFLNLASRHRPSAFFSFNLSFQIGAGMQAAGLLLVAMGAFAVVPRRRVIPGTEFVSQQNGSAPVWNRSRVSHDRDRYGIAQRYFQSDHAELRPLKFSRPAVLLWPLPPSLWRYNECVRDLEAGRQEEYAANHRA